MSDAGEKILEGLEQAVAIETYRRLYKVDANGKMRVWFMQRTGHHHRVVAGFDGGSLVENAWTECKSKGKGKAQTTPEEQAIKEVDALYEKNLKRDYYATPEEARGPARNFLPMLANSWKDTTWSKWVARAPQSTGAFWQPKLDGYCCIARASGLQSREGLPILTAPHVMEALAPLFAVYPDAVLHGELYNHDLKNEFEKLGSLLKKQKDITEEHIAEVRAKVQYHVYDYPGVGEDKGFHDRTASLHHDISNFVGEGAVQLVKTYQVASEEELLELTAHAVQEGYEGGIGRLDLPYEKAKRSWSVIKIKTFDDEEFEVIRIEEGKGNYAGFAKRVVCRDHNGAEFEAGIKGKKDQWLADLLHADHKIVTIKYFGRTQGGQGVPRMGVATKWHGAERVL